MTNRTPFRSTLLAATFLAALVSCAGEASGPKKATGTTDAGGASSGASDTGPVPDAGAPSCEKLSVSAVWRCREVPNCTAIGGPLVESNPDGTGFHTTDIQVTYGCATIPCEPYEGPICKEGTAPMDGTVGWLGLDGPDCIPHGWVACPEVDVTECGLAPDCP